MRIILNVRSRNQSNVGNRIYFRKTMKLVSKLKEKARKLKSEVQVLIIVYKDKRTPVVANILIGLTVAYLLSPVDLIPDFIPVLGLLDDLIIVPLLIRLSIKLIPKNVLYAAREMVRLNPEKLKKTNWIFAILFVGIWVTVLLYV